MRLSIGAAGSDHEMNFGVTGEAAPNAALSKASPRLAVLNYGTYPEEPRCRQAKP